MSKTHFRSGRKVARKPCGLAIMCALFAMVCSAQPALAALGGDVASVQADQLHMQGTLRTSAAASYSVHEIHSAAGTVVREYVSSAGKVFAVTWQGQWPPDMRQLLGNYFEQYAQAVKAQSSARIGRRPVEIEQPGLVVQMVGHPRSFRGRAYIPDLLPADVAAEAIE